ncbi:Guanine nucleotide-binding protein alpha-4 subunit [Leucoagaricus sp. SymC.cos]|nr:Guanine nucleotide-binding protein alpha-4 subunit [Leucoagaricus sp. SymC.cos]
MPKFRRTHDSYDTDEDPLARAIAPPPDEDPRAREIRLAKEAEAQRRSDAIDEELNRQRQAEKRAPKCIRILLLGQSESGKSTTLKNFQLIHSPKAFQNEKASWRAVIQLNVTRSIRLILEAMTETQLPPGDSSRPNSPSPPADLPALSPEHLRLKMRLLPLQQVEENLLRRLSSAGSSEIEATHLSPVTNLPYSGRAGKAKEVTVNSTSQWKGAFSRLLSNARSSFESGADINFSDPNDPGVVLHACAEDMILLWNDPTIKQLLSARKQRLEDMAGFFLDSLERVTSLRYVPTDGKWIDLFMGQLKDILRARLKTIGVSEHRFTLKAGNMLSHDWRIYDVGGARINIPPAAWAPYFDNMDAIIFLAPISCFDQVLEEDPSVNRLEDSILLWKSIVSNPLLKNTETVLFLNKIDIMRAKLQAGIQFGHYVISYGNRPNDFETAAAYLKKKFAALHKQHSSSPRMFYCHMTTATDPKSTQHILGNVKDMVIRQNLQDSSLV